MFSNTSHWGEIDEKTDDQYAYLPKVNFSPLIELALTQVSWCPPRPLGAAVGLPLPSVTLKAALLAEHARQLEGSPRGEYLPGLEGLDLPPPDTACPQHHAKPPLRFIEKDYCLWSRGVGPPSLGRASSADCRLSLQQAAALELATHPASLSACRTVIETLADAGDHFLRQITQTMRVIADREASNRPSGFPDLISKTFSELGIIGIHSWYNERVLGARLRAAHKIKMAEPPPAPEEVPELHFPASLEALGEGSLGPGYRMLHSLENDLPRLPMHLELQLDEASPLSSAGNVT